MFIVPKICFYILAVTPDNDTKPVPVLVAAPAPSFPVTNSVEEQTTR
jgi:hypothetical protein